MDSIMERVRIHEWNLPDSEPEDRAAAPHLTAFGDEQRQAAECRVNTRGVETAEQTAAQVAISEAMPLPEGQLIQIVEIEDMPTVEQRRPVVHVGVIAVRVDARLVLVGNVLVERLRKGIAGVKRKAVRSPLAQRRDQNVVIGPPNVGAHVQVEKLLILIVRQP